MIIIPVKVIKTFRNLPYSPIERAKSNKESSIDDGKVTFKNFKYELI